MLEKKDSEAVNSSAGDTLYLCNFRVSVDGDWLCLKEVDDQDVSSLAKMASEAAAASASASEVTRQRQPPDTLAITPELDRLEKIYPNYPVGNAKGLFIF